MRITVFGATSPTGRAFIDRAEARGNATVAVVRDPARLQDTTPTFTVVGSVFDRAVVRDSIAGSDAVFLTLGARGNRKSHLYSIVTQSIVEAMRAEEVSRIVVMSEAAYDHHTTGLLNRMISFAYAAVSRPVIKERRHQDQILAESGLSWTIVRPGVLTDSADEEPLERRTLPHGRLTDRTGRLQLADLVLNSLDHPGTYQKSLYP
ncbi:NAD(P)-dependent oxidoreductase [Rhodococcus sp. NPDC057529]|uniref:NAD(P)-dependent oxidoreductase n=1 Tax=Rhodococcus sp. NPDC057529 TaxID=3346158 RepID=UPI00366BC12B